MRHVVMMSSGAGSWAAAKRVVERFGRDDVTMLFADVKGDNSSPHAGEDEDNYRFLSEASSNVGAELVRVVEGRDIWEVFFDEHMLGNNRAPICSMRLKQEPTRAWVEANCPPDETVIYLGLDWTEQHRHEPNRRGWAPYVVEYPMMDEPWIDKALVLDWLAAEGVAPPRLYDLGYSHANCGGFCVQMGQADAARLLRTNPERYAYHEAKEQAFRLREGKDVAFLVDRRHKAILSHFGLHPSDVTRLPPVEHEDRSTSPGPWVVIATGEQLPGRVPLTLRDLRWRLETDARLFDPDDTGACGCFPFAEVAVSLSTIAPSTGTDTRGDR